MNSKSSRAVSRPARMSILRQIRETERLRAPPPPPLLPRQLSRLLRPLLFSSLQQLLPRPPDFYQPPPLRADEFCDSTRSISKAFLCAAANCRTVRAY